VTVRDVLVHELSEQLGCPVAEVEDTSTLVDDLGADSLDLVELLMTAEERFGVEIPDEVGEAWKTVGEALAWLEANGATVQPEPQGGW